MRPAGGPLRVLVEVVPLDQPPAEVGLRPTVIRGGLGAHKWLDRRLLADMARSMALQPGEQLLIEDADGDVLETDRANVFAVHRRGAAHPARRRTAAAGRRPGMPLLRAAGIEGLGISVTPLNRARLQAATEVFVTNAVHGVRPVRSIAGSPAAWPAGPVAAGWQRPWPGSRPASATPVTASHAGRLRPAWQPGRRQDRGGPVTVLIDNYDSFTYNLAHMLASQRLPRGSRPQ